MSNWTVLHLHSDDSNPYSGFEVDSITPYQMYIDAAKECGMKAIAFTEHGVVLHNKAKKTACDKAGIKYIHAEEFYVTESLDKDNLIRDNYHCCLYAKNHDGVKELNKLSSKAFNRDDGHYYYNPRITIDELESTSDNILILTACVSGILCKGTPAIKERFFDFILKNKDRCWLEIQPHTFQRQIEYNQFLFINAYRNGLRLIATNDIHALNKDHLNGRAIMQASKQKAKNTSAIEELDYESDCDLTFKTYDEMVAAFEKQDAFPKDVYLEALEETNRFADLIEDYEFDYSNKYPRLYGDRSEEEFVSRIKAGVKDRGIDILPNFESEYVPRIKEEFETYKHNDAIDFMLLDSDYKQWMLDNGMNYGISRGSVSGSLIAYLIKSTDVDSVKYNLNFSRFMNQERVSLADVDTDIYKEDRYKVREYFFNRKGLNCCNIVTFNTVQMRMAIKDIGRAFGLTPVETQDLSNMVVTDDGKDSIPDNVRNKYPELFKYVDMVIGVTTSLGRHAAGIVCSPTDVEEDFGTLTIKTDSRPVSQIDMHELDSLNYVKMDLLGLDTVGLISKTCELAGIDYLKPEDVDFSNEEVINSIAEDTTLIFQFESDYAGESLKRALSQSTLANIRKKNEHVSYLDIMSMTSGALRPAGESYRNDLFNGIYRDNGNEALNNFLMPTLGNVVYQEQIIDFLHDFCGFTMGQADVVRRHFSKKEGTENDIPVIENGGYLIDIKGNRDERKIKGFVATAQEQYGMSEEEAKKTIKYFLQVILDASSYLFSKNHAVPYSMMGFFIGWLRLYYPLELITAALNIYADNDEKSRNIKSYALSKGISINGIQFGKSKADYFMDKEGNAIYQGIAAIKECNATIGEELYQLSQDNEYNSFMRLLADIKENTSVNTKQKDILIKLDFFKDFGSISYLLECNDLFEKYYGKKQMRKDKALEESISFDTLRSCSERETDKTFLNIDSMKMLESLISDIPNDPTPLRIKIFYQMENLGYIDIVDKKYKGFCVATDLSVDYTPKIKLYALANGRTIPVKVNKKIFSANPIKRGDIVKVLKQERKPKRQKVNERWVESSEKEWWITEYKIV